MNLPPNYWGPPIVHPMKGTAHGGRNLQSLLREAKTIYVSNIPWFAKREDLIKCFLDALMDITTNPTYDGVGEIVIRWKQNTTYAFITMRTMEEANLLVQLKYLFFGGRKMTIARTSQYENDYALIRLLGPALAPMNTQPPFSIPDAEQVTLTSNQYVHKGINQEMIEMQDQDIDKDPDLLVFKSIPKDWKEIDLSSFCDKYGHFVKYFSFHTRKDGENEFLYAHCLSVNPEGIIEAARVVGDQMNVVRVNGKKSPPFPIPTAEELTLTSKQYVHKGSNQERILLLENMFSQNVSKAVTDTEVVESIVGHVATKYGVVSKIVAYKSNTEVRFIDKVLIVYAEAVSARRALIALNGAMFGQRKAKATLWLNHPILGPQ